MAILCSRAQPFLRILVQSHPRNITMKLSENWSTGLRGDVIRFSIFSSGSHLVYQSGTSLPILVGSHLGNIPVISESHWPKGLRGDSI